MSEFRSPVDIANRALQRVGAEPIFSLNDNSARASAVLACYGKLRQAELQRNIWTFATVQAAIRAVDTSTALLNPTLWSGTVTYFLGSVVVDQDGVLWESLRRDNLNNQPGSSTAWKPYFGPLTAGPFDSSIAYFNGELIYTIKGDGTFNVFKSMSNGNSVHPAMPNLWAIDTVYNIDDVIIVWPAWSSGTTYSRGQTVLFTDGNVYSSLTNGNLNNLPVSGGANWALMPTLKLSSQQFPTSSNASPASPIHTPIDEWQIDTTYTVGQFVIFNTALYVSIANNNTQNFPTAAPTFWAACTGGTSYQSLVDFNQGNSPAGSPAQWTTTFTLGGGNSLWIQIGGSAFPNGVSLSAFRLTYPIGSGPRSQTRTKNVYLLPGNHLRKAPQDPRAGSFSILGAPANLQQVDWTFQDRFLVTWDSVPIVYRFIADVQEVRNFNPLFCEMLSCSMALEVVEKLTQSAAKKQVIAQEYKLRRTEAITVDAIETGGIEPPLDDFIAARM